MSSCTHEFKQRIYGPFAKGSGSEQHYKVICKFCNATIGDIQMDTKRNTDNVSLQPHERCPLPDLLDKAQSARNLTAWDKTFLDSFREKLDKFDGNVFVSEKQQMILDKIQLKVLGKHNGTTTANTSPVFDHNAADCPF